MNKEQIIDEAYENYSKEYEKDNSIGMCLLVARMDGKSTYRKPNKEMFVDLCTYDKTFSQKWGLKIEEREFSLEERNDIYKKQWETGSSELSHDRFDALNIPTKHITITYKDTVIESYE